MKFFYASRFLLFSYSGKCKVFISVLFFYLFDTWVFIINFSSTVYADVLGNVYIKIIPVFTDNVLVSNQILIFFQYDIWIIFDGTFLRQERLDGWPEILVFGPPPHRSRKYTEIDSLLIMVFIFLSLVKIFQFSCV